MMKSWRFAIASAMAFSLSACALGSGDGVAWRPSHWCDSGGAKMVKLADWPNAKTIHLKFNSQKYDTISLPIPDENRNYTTDRYHRLIGGFEVRTDQLEPRFSKIDRGEPYILKVKNTDKVPRTLYGYDFFKEMAVAKVINAGKTVKKKCVLAVTIPGQQSAEIHFVAAKSGNYELEDNAVTLMPGLGSAAFISIQ